MTTSPLTPPLPLTVASLTQDARNRALRTFVQGLVVDVVVAVAVILLPQLASAHSFADLNWGLLAFLLAKTVVVSGLSYVMRRFGDTSRLPTLVPPSDPHTAAGVTAVTPAVPVTLIP